MKKLKKILSLDDLVQFCSQNNIASFDAGKEGYRLSVHVPATFDLEGVGKDYSNQDLLRLKFKIIHSGRNRNGSIIDEADANRAKTSFAYRPILATIHQLEDGSWDFGSHDMEIVELDNGDMEIVYREKQVGSFTEEEPFWEKDEKTGYNYLCAYGVIPTEYTKAAEILQKKNGTKVSAEISVGSAVYDVKEGGLKLKDWFLSGCTMLGRSVDSEEEVEEGMVGARADLVDFSEEKNSIVDRLAKMQESMDALAAKFADLSNTKSLEKGGNPDMFDELLKQYGKTKADITFETDGLSDDELRVKFEEMFGEVSEDTPESGENEDAKVTPTNDETFENEGGTDSDSEATDGTSDTDSVEDDNTQTDESSDVGQEDSDPVSDTSENTASSDDDEEIKKQYNFTAPNGKTFAISLNRRISAIYDYVNDVYAEQDGDWYSVEVFDDSVVMTGWLSGKSYRQKYQYANDTVVLLDSREEVYPEYLTKSEQDALALMRGSFDELQAFKAEREAEEKQKVLDQFEAQIGEIEEFTELKSQVENFSAEEIELRCNAIVGKNAMKTFAKEDKKKSTIALPFFKHDNKKESPYGGVFKK